MKIFGKGHGFQGLPKNPNWKWAAILCAFFYVIFSAYISELLVGIIAFVIVTLIVRWVP